MMREPGSQTHPAQHQLHNCGPVSREVFRTPAIGRLTTFDLRRTLLGWTAGREGFDLAAAWPEDTAHVPAPFVVSIAHEVLCELGIEPPSVEVGEAARARRCLAALVEGLQARGKLRRLVGIAFHAARDDDPVVAPARTPSTLQFATTLAVYAVYAPPLLLWTRGPSLRWLRADTLIMLRRFDAPAERRRA
jgi:hypothetical protein